jgi:transcriptional regulator with XRE-family HTH domain
MSAVSLRNPLLLESLRADGQDESLEDTEPYGAVLRARRCHAGLTQEDLSVRSAVSRSTIQNLERELVQVPREATHQLLLDALAPYVGPAARTQLEDAYLRAKRQAVRKEALRVIEKG